MPELLPLPGEPAEDVPFRDPYAPSARFLAREAALADVRAALLAWGRPLGVFERWVCKCGSPSCLRASDAVFSVDHLLGAAFTFWDPDADLAQAAADPSGERAETLRAALLDFGDQVDLFACACSDPACLNHRAGQLPAAELIRLASQNWQARAATFYMMPLREEMQQAYEFVLRNQQLIVLAATRMRYIPLARWQPVPGRIDAVRASLWTRESREMVRTAATRWAKDALQSGEAMEIARRVSERIAIEGPWSQSEDRAAQMRDWLDAIGFAIEALLVVDIADDDFVDTLWEPIADVLSIRELKSSLATLAEPAQPAAAAQDA